MPKSADIDPPSASGRFHIATALDATAFARFVNQVVGAGLWTGGAVIVEIGDALAGDEGTVTLLDFAVSRLAHLQVRTVVRAGGEIRMGGGTASSGHGEATRGDRWPIPR